LGQEIGKIGLVLTVDLAGSPTSSQQFHHAFWMHGIKESRTTIGNSRTLGKFTALAFGLGRSLWAAQALPFSRNRDLEQSARAGFLYAITGFAILSMGDAVIKSMAGAWPAIGVAVLRFTFGAIALSTLLYFKEGTSGFRPSNPALQFARGVCLAAASMCFFSAIYLMPLADAMAIAFLAPILTAILSGPVLGETVRLPAWIASAVALGGVMLILRPNLAALGWPAILPIISAFFFAMMVVLNRKSAGQGSVLSMQAFVAIVASFILICCAVIARAFSVEQFIFGWPDWDVVARCAIVATTASIAHWLAYLGTTRAGAAQVAPATYVQMLVATLLGWAFFNDVPDALTLTGAAIIIGAGLFLWRHNIAEEARIKSV
jgi:drug/metabolite transporter (DMT)-like permease